MEVTLPRYLEPTRVAIGAVLARARSLDDVLEDVHTLAYDKHAGEGDHRGTRSEWYLDEVGQAKAKRSLADLERFMLKISKEIEVQYANIYSLFSGEGANDKLRGTTLGDEHGHKAQIELKQLVNSQRARKERGEYTPHPSEEQPEVPKR